jgi:5'-nucleotidase / UDP-sugar diphosphatase
VGDIDRGYRAIDVGGKDERLYNLTCPLMLGSILVGVPKYIQGKLPLVPKNNDGQPLTSRVEALADPHSNTYTLDLLSPVGTVDKSIVATDAGRGAVREVKEWQAILDHLRSPPVNSAARLPSIAVDERVAVVRAIKVG